ncbi:YaiI/YqxD family protein [Mammaliicoccus stepanovicii]|uniref:YaiI/YqxD family protein n=1 Tax=Mammaliicoccus stepanovicii TaxID=643214 RepID=UPI000BA2F70F|nr:YaiI/YqxD family protein [Mammaliicoccus stepanovicii]PNZ72007.1 YaiI/YqxD family protein [Mammaliicoccus stepanovicii]
MRRIIIDGDACPVTDDIIRITEGTGIFVLIIRSVNHFSLKEYPDHVSTTYVDHGVDSVDFRIVKLTTADDIVVTQDYGLASLIINKAKHVVHHLAYEYTSQNIEQLLTQRHISAQVRQQGGRTKGPKKLTSEDHEAFSIFFKNLINEQSS